MLSNNNENPFGISTLILLLITFTSCDNNVTDYELKGYVRITATANDSIVIKYDDEIVFDGKVDCDIYEPACILNDIKNTDIGVHKIEFNAPKDMVKHENMFFVEDSLKIIIRYYGNSDTTKFYDFITTNIL